MGVQHLLIKGPSMITLSAAFGIVSNNLLLKFCLLMLCYFMQQTHMSAHVSTNYIILKTVLKDEVNPHLTFWPAVIAMFTGGAT